MKKTLLLLALLAQNLAFAQQTQTGTPGKNLHLLARVHRDSVVLRWGIGDAAAWILNHANGFKIERLDFRKTKSDTLAGDLKRLSGNEPFRAKPRAFFENELKKKPVEAEMAVAGQALYGKTMVVKNEDEFQFDGFGGEFLRGEAELTSRWSFAHLAADLSPRAADALALRWVDRRPPTDGLCLYRLILLAGPNGGEADTATILLRTGQETEPVFSPDLLADGQEKAVRLFWDGGTPTEAGLPSFSCFWVEKRVAGSQKWQPLFEKPVLATRKKEGQTFQWVDSVAANYVKADYRLVAQTAFGERVQPSKTVTGFGRDRTPPYGPSAMKAESTAENFIKISWKKPDLEPDLAGLRVERSFQVDGPFEPIHPTLLPENSLEFIDRKPYLLSATYYRTVAVDTSGNVGPSYSTLASVVDSVAPAAPLGLRGSIDSTGLVSISWPLGPEPDIFGYRIFWANQADHEFSNLTPEPLADTIFQHQLSLKTLTEKAFFRIVAVDRHFNHSAFSKIFEVKRRDTIPPVRPIWSDYSIEKKGKAVRLAWVPSSSKDVVAHRILRRSDGQKDWQPVHSFSKKERGWLDETPPAGRIFYAIEAVDEAGNRSGWHTPAEFQLTSNGPLPPVSQFFASQEEGVISLGWDYETAEKGHFFLIYRAKGTEKLELWRSVDGNLREFEDRATSRPASWRYAVVVRKRGREDSVSSEERAVRLD